MTGRAGAGGGVRVVTGEPGCGRTTFLNGAARSFPAGTVVRVEADPAASHVPLGGLRALLHALGAPAGARPAADPPSTALLGALRAASARAPLLVCADDAHLWDAATRTAVGRAAAHLRGDGPVRMLLSVAGHRRVDPEFAGLAVVRVDPLTPARAAALVDEAAGGPVDRAVRDHLVDAAGGNPALLLAMVRRLSPAQLRGARAMTRPPADAELLTRLVGGLPAGCTPEGEDLVLTVAAALRDRDADDARDARVDVTLALRAADRLGATRPGRGPAGPPAPLPEVLDLVDSEVGFHSDLLRRAVYCAAPPERRRAAHRALAGALGEARAAGLEALLHRARSAPAPRPATAAALARAAGDPAHPASHGLRCAAFTRAGELADDHGRRAEWYTAAAEQALLGGRAHRALRLLDSAREDTAPVATRGRVELVRGTTVLVDGPVDEARASLLVAARLLAASAPRQAQSALLAASDAAWAAGDASGCLGALTPPAAPDTAQRTGGDRVGHPRSPGTATATGDVAAAVAVAVVPEAEDGCVDRYTDGRLDEHPDAHPDAHPDEHLDGRLGGLADRHPDVHGAGSRRGRMGPSATPSVPGAGVSDCLVDYRAGVGALLAGRFAQAAGPLRRLVADAERAPHADEPEAALRAAAAALLLGDLVAARRTGARALAVARTTGAATALARAREYLAYAELRAGRHALARTHAEEGLRAALRTGQRNRAAQHHAVLALAASIEAGPDEVAAHAGAALAVARQHGLAQVATLAEWATARADLARGRPREAADRLAPLVRPGARRGHFAVWMLAVPCFVEASAAAGPVHAGLPVGAAGAADVPGVVAVVDEFARWAGFGADPQAPAQLLRCRALLAPQERADALYRAALDLHEANGSGDFERARTELLHGKWLRRRRRLREARDRLGGALVGFERCGARVWADQARAELRAGGAAPAGGEKTTGLSALTPQQLRIARCVAEGATNREVALTLSVSTRTVDYHLRKVFAALGVRSRVELARLVDRAG